MYALLFVLLVIAAILYGSLKYRETFVIKYGNPFSGEDLVSFDANAPGTRAFGWTPDTCPASKPEYEGGLCYASCDEGYHGVADRCWADTQNIGVGKVLIATSCAGMGKPDWADTGLLCNEPLKWNNCKFRGLFNECWGGLEGGNVIVKELTCNAYGDEYPDKIDNLLCYRKCPADKPTHVPLMPYLCYKGTRGISYDRGVGDVPPIYTFS
jgi:hypothetical protein